MQAVAQTALSDEFFFEAYDLLLERFYNRALYMCLLDLLLASLLKILDVLLLPQTLPIRGHAVFFLARTFARYLSVSDVALDRSSLRPLPDTEETGVWTSGAEIL